MHGNQSIVYHHNILLLWILAAGWTDISSVYYYIYTTNNSTIQYTVPPNGLSISGVLLQVVKESMYCGIESALGRYLAGGQKVTKSISDLR